MANFDLTNVLISDGFKNLLQVRREDKTIFDALGNRLDDFRLSGSFTTSEFLEIENGTAQSSNRLHSRDGELYWGPTLLADGTTVTGLQNLSEDSTPQLGGDLDLNDKDINGDGNFLIQGSNFNLSKIIDQILFEDTNKAKLFDHKERSFKINFKKNNIDDEHYVLNLKGDFKMKGNDIYDLSLNSSFPNKDILSMSIKTKNDQKVTTFYSEQAKPFVKKYKFVKGFEDGKLDFYSVKENQVSKSQIKIFEFSLMELPALTKILTLASLQGIADILSGDGVGFDELEMNFNSKKNLMEIEELYAIGPAISILMDGYVQKDELVSLRGTLVPATTINKFVGSIPILGDILVGKKTGEGVFGVSFKLKGHPKDIKTSVNPIKTLTPRFITRTLEKIKRTN